MSYFSQLDGSERKGVESTSRFEELYVSYAKEDGRLLLAASQARSGGSIMAELCDALGATKKTTSIGSDVEPHQNHVTSRSFPLSFHGTFQQLSRKITMEPQT